VIPVADPLPRPLLDLDRLGQVARTGRQAFASADPYPHAVIDDFADPEALSRVVAEFEQTQQGWDHYYHYNERKVALTKFDEFGPRVKELVEALHSPRFLSIVEQLTGLEQLLPDWELDGAGLHKSPPGGFLNLHTDFLSHPSQPTWIRQINLLLYLNPTWSDEWGGALELWNADTSRCGARIDPIFNRCVIFHTTDTSYHGHPKPLACPPDVERRSLALYYYQESNQVQRVSSTHYRGSPEDSRLRRAMIALDRQAVRAFSVVRRHTGLSDRVVSRILRRL